MSWRKVSALLLPAGNDSELYGTVAFFSVFLYFYGDS